MQIDEVGEDDDRSASASDEDLDDNEAEGTLVTWMHYFWFEVCIHVAKVTYPNSKSICGAIIDSFQNQVKIKFDEPDVNLILEGCELLHEAVTTSYLRTTNKIMRVTCSDIAASAPAPAMSQIQLSQNLEQQVQEKERNLIFPFSQESKGMLKS